MFYPGSEIIFEVNEYKYDLRSEDKYNSNFELVMSISNFDFYLVPIFELKLKRGQNEWFQFQFWFQMWSEFQFKKMSSFSKIIPIQKSIVRVI